MKPTGRIIGASIVIAVCCSVLVLAQPNKQYRRMYDVATPELLRRGQTWLERAQGADSALVCFSLAASRYDQRMSRQDKELMVKANIGKWLVYFSYLFDYPKAYESLEHAIAISEEAGINKAGTELSMGGMLHMIADQSGSPDLYRQALTEYASSIREAEKVGDNNTADKAFVNMLVASRSLDNYAAIDSVYFYYRTFADARLPRRRLAKVMYRASRGDTAAVSALSAEIDRLPGAREYVRLRFIGYKTESEILLSQGDTTGAERVVRRALAHALDNGLRDGEMEARLLLSDILRSRGDINESLDERDKYLRIKEEKFGSKQLHRLDELRFLADLRAADERLAVSKEERRRQRDVIIALGALIALAVAFIWVTVHKNIRLRQAYDSLTQRFQASMAADDRERRLLHKLAEIDRDADAADNEVMESQVKYEGSSLGDKERARILALLSDFAADPQLICSPGCTVGKLADAIGCNAKYLSQIINDEYQCNFNTFINQIRIKEACRRIIAGGEWSKLTMEAIANSVGFKSKSTFFQFFKQCTGVTPSEFRRSTGV